MAYPLDETATTTKGDAMTFEVHNIPFGDDASIATLAAIGWTILAAHVVLGAENEHPALYGIVQKGTTFFCFNRRMSWRRDLASINPAKSLVKHHYEELCNTP